MSLAASLSSLLALSAGYAFFLMWTVNRRLLSIVILALSACSTRCHDGGGGMHDGRLGEFAAVSTEVHERPAQTTLPEACIGD